MSRTIKMTLLFLLFLTSISYGASKNELLDIGVLKKKDGKALMFIFKNPISQKDRRIKFSGNRLTIILYDFSAQLKEVSHIQKYIPAIKDFVLLNKEGNINIILRFKDEVSSLLLNRNLTFLTNDPYMLGIMFTKDYLDSFNKTTLPIKVTQKLKEQQSEDTAVSLEKKVIKSNKDTKKAKNEDIDLPFIKYEDIFALPEKKEKKVQDSSYKKEEPQHTQKYVSLLTKKPAAIKHELPTKEKGHLSLLKLVSSLSAVLGIVIVSLFLWKKMLLFKYKANSHLIKILGVHYFGAKQFIAVVQIGEEKFLLGISSDNIQLITKLAPGIIQTPSSAFEEEKQESSVSQKAADMLKKKFAQLKRV